MLCKVYVEKFKSEIKEQQERKEKRKKRNNIKG